MTFLAWVTMVLSLASGGGLPTSHTSFIPQPCPAYKVTSSCWDRQTRTIYLPDPLLASVLHEEGHAVASDLLTPKLKRRYEALAGYRPGTAWLGEQWQSPSESFADAYASCAMGRHVGLWVDNKWWLGPHTDLKPVCRLIRSLR